MSNIIKITCNNCSESVSMKDVLRDRCPHCKKSGFTKWFRDTKGDEYYYCSKRMAAFYGGYEPEVCDSQCEQCFKQNEL